MHTTEHVPPLAAIIVGSGYAPNRHLLAINGAIRMPSRRGVWAAPSRVFEWPIDYRVDFRTTAETLTLRHPLLRSSPSVVAFREKTGLDPQDGPEDDHRGWIHAVDLCSDATFDALLDTRDFTSPAAIIAAIPHHIDAGGKTRPRTLSAHNARLLLSMFAPDEPMDRSTALRDGMKRGTLLSNVFLRDRAAKAWMAVHGVEDGWIVADRSGFPTVAGCAR